MTLKKSIFIIVLILLIDQISKVYIKTHFTLGESVKVFSWFQILFVENEGMAWGAKIPGQYGKLILTLFRLFAIMGIGYWLWDAIRKKCSKRVNRINSIDFCRCFWEYYRFGYIWANIYR